MVKKRSSNKANKLIDWMVVVSILSIILSSYLLYLHYSDSSSFCDVSEGLSCDIVNRSIYSEFPPGSGIPVSLMGLLTFLFVILILKFIFTDKKFKIGKEIIDKHLMADFIFYLMIISVLFALYLIYTELFLILSVCILCVVLDIFIVIMLVLSYKLRGALNETS